MKNCVCTIVTPDFLANGLTTLYSMRNFYKDVDFYILYMDNYMPNCSLRYINILNLNLLEENYKKISEKYGIISDKTRWALKPQLILELLKNYEKVIYVDPDIYFVSDWKFLIDEIDGVLLTRHWRSFSTDHNGFSLNFTDGFFNGGFIGCSKKSIDAINWWSEACMWKCEISKKDGLFVDQKYLDFMYVHFPNVDYCKHQGCNLAGWNTKELKRFFIKNTEEIIVNKNCKAVFLHFSFIHEDDVGIFHYYQKYKKTIKDLKNKYKI